MSITFGAHAGTWVLAIRSHSAQGQLRSCSRKKSRTVEDRSGLSESSRVCIASSSATDALEPRDKQVSSVDQSRIESTNAMLRCIPAAGAGLVRRDSFDSVCKAATAQNGTLAIPSDLVRPATLWWDGWKARKRRETGIHMDLWPRAHIEDCCVSRIWRVFVNS